MSSFETLQNDNLVWDEIFDPREQDSSKVPFLRKSNTYVTDMQAGQGTYNKEVIIDSQGITGSGAFCGHREGYLVVAKRTTVELETDTNSAAGATQASINSQLVAALKNNAQIDSIKLECNGKTIITSTQNLAHLVNIKMLSTMTQDQLKKDASTLNFYPDDIGKVGSIATSANNGNVLDNTGLTYVGKPFRANRGLMERQQNWLPPANASFLTAAQRKNEGMIFNTVTTEPIVANITALTANTKITIFDCHYLVIIRNRDIIDFFDKSIISRGVSYRYTIWFNQGVSVATFGSSTTPFATEPTVAYTPISGNTCPSMICAGPGCAFSVGTLTTAGVVKLTLTDRIDETANQIISGVRLYIPQYEFEPSYQEKLLSTAPVLKRTFMDFLSQPSQASTAAGLPFNIQVSTSCTNPAALIVIPRISSASQGYYSDASSLSTVPGTTDGLLSITNLQVRMGSNYVLPDRVFYTYQMFIDHVSAIFGTDGGLTNRSSGLISKKMFETNHRYYCIDLSRYPAAMENMPQMISVEGINNSNVSCDYLCLLLYKRTAEWDLRAGSMVITA